MGWSKLKYFICVLLVTGGLQFLIDGPDAHADNTVVSQMAVENKNYVRKSTNGAMYNFQINGDQVEFGKRIHSLANYPNTTWQVTKRMYLKRGEVTYLYYYITNKKGTVQGWVWNGYLTPGTTTATLIGFAKNHLGKPYYYGATGPSAFDCSGFTQYVFNQATGKKLPRTAQAQYNSSKKVSVNALKRGDLAFFGNSANSISHVGIYLGGGQMIDAQNRGVITEAVNAPWWNIVGYARPTNLN